MTRHLRAAIALLTVRVHAARSDESGFAPLTMVLGVSLVTIAGAVAGSHGYLLFSR